MSLTNRTTSTEIWDEEEHVATVQYNHYSEVFEMTLESEEMSVDGFKALVHGLLEFKMEMMH